MHKENKAESKSEVKADRKRKRDESEESEKNVPKQVAKVDKEARENEAYVAWDKGKFDLFASSIENAKETLPSKDDIQQIVAMIPEKSTSLFDMDGLKKTINAWGDKPKRADVTPVLDQLTKEADKIFEFYKGQQPAAESARSSKE